MTESRRWHWRWLSEERGEAIVSFAFALPVLLGLSVAILEFSLIVFDFHRAGEAARRGARLAALSLPVADTADFVEGSVATCTSSGTVSCTNGPAVRPENFDAMLAAMQDIYPSLGPANVELVYTASGIGEAGTPAGILPLVTVRLRDVEHPYTMLKFVPGMPDTLVFPSFATNQVGRNG